MPQNKLSNKPPKVMTWKGAAPILIVAALFDAVRLMFEMFWFFGPALAAIYCTVKASSAVGALGGLTAFICSLAAGAGGFAGAPAIETFGVIMAMATGFAGWLIVGGWIVMTNSRIFKENASSVALFGASLLVSEVPIVGSLPAISVITWRLYHTQIKKDKTTLQKYEADQVAVQTQQQQQQTVQLMQAQAIGQARTEQE
ncbi:hypothetical protein D4R49_01025, partial [bacterium]